MSAEILVEPDVSGVVRKLASVVEESANEAIDRDGIFKIGLSGRVRLLFSFLFFLITKK